MCLHTVISEGQGKPVWMGDFIKVNPWGRTLPYFEVFFNFIIDIQSEGITLSFLSRGELDDIQSIDYYVENGDDSGFNRWLNKLIFKGGAEKGLFNNGDGIVYDGRPVQMCKDAEIINHNVEFGDKDDNEKALFSTFDLKLRNRGLTMVSLQYLLQPFESIENAEKKGWKYDIVCFDEVLNGVYCAINNLSSPQYGKRLHDQIKDQFSEYGNNRCLLSEYSMGLISTPGAHFDIYKQYGLLKEKYDDPSFAAPFLLSYKEEERPEVVLFRSDLTSFDLSFAIEYG